VIFRAGIVRRIDIFFLNVFWRGFGLDGVGEGKARNGMEWDVRLPTC
jgi:hypothetical protein